MEIACLPFSCREEMNYSLWLFKKAGHFAILASDKFFSPPSPIAILRTRLSLLVRLSYRDIIDLVSQRKQINDNCGFVVFTCRFFQFALGIAIHGT
jgi:hypothetical protein